MKTSYIIEGKRKNLERRKKDMPKNSNTFIKECKGIEMKR